MNAKTCVCIQRMQKFKYMLELVGASFVVACKNMLETCFWSFLLASTRLADTSFWLVFARLVHARKNMYLLAHTGNKQKGVRTCICKFVFTCENMFEQVVSNSYLQILKHAPTSSDMFLHAWYRNVFACLVHTCKNMFLLANHLN